MRDKPPELEVGQDIPDEDPFEEFDESFDEPGPDCGMGEDGQCQYAGSEECDECPYWDED